MTSAGAGGVKRGCARGCVAFGALGWLLACGGDLGPGGAPPGSVGTTPAGDMTPDGSAALCIPANDFSGNLVYVQKEFLIAPSQADSQHPYGWNVRVTVTSTTPSSSLSTVTWSDVARFQITEDRLELSMERDPPLPLVPGSGNLPGVEDTWPGSNFNVGTGADCPTSLGPEWQTDGWIAWDFTKSNASDDLALLNYAVAPPDAGAARGAEGWTEWGNHWPEGPPEESWTPQMQALFCLEQSSSITSTLVPGSFAINASTSAMSWRETVTVQVTTACPGVAQGSMTLALSFFLSPG